MTDPEMDAPVLTAEEAFVGALMWCDTPAAAQAVTWLRTEDFSSPAAALVHRLVNTLVERGNAPDPSSVLALAISSDTVTGPQKIHDLTRTLWTLFDYRATVPMQLRFYACAALDQAIRRRTVEMAERLRQVAGRADLDEIERLTRSEQAEIDRLRDRLRRLAGEVSETAA